jgi:hypothetical protein
MAGALSLIRRGILKPKQDVEVSYLARGLNWNADYVLVLVLVLVLDERETRADLTGWVTLVNRSGTSYADAELKLVAGDVQLDWTIVSVESPGGAQGRIVVRFPRQGAGSRRSRAQLLGAGALVLSPGIHAFASKSSS